MPSRTDVQEYQELKDELDREIGRINGRFSTTRWSPIRYVTCVCGVISVMVSLSFKYKMIETNKVIVIDNSIKKHSLFTITLQNVYIVMLNN